MRAYFEFAFKTIHNKSAYRLDCFMGIVATVFSYVVYISIYKALYGAETEIDGISFGMVATSFIISMGLSNAFSYNEMFFPDKINNGSISNEFLKPVSFRLRLLFENIGESVFKLIFNFIPSVIFAIFYTGIMPPSSVWNLLLMLLSVMLGYLILWEMSFIIQTWCFWIISVWGFITIKNVLVNILAGIMLPIWFMPEWLRQIIKFTPFESVYFTPVRLYLGQLGASEALLCLLGQAIWVIILYIIGDIFWHRGVKKLIVQGG